MQQKKTFKMPEIEVIKFDMKDVITTSPGSPTPNIFKTNGTYDYTNIGIN